MKTNPIHRSIAIVAPDYLPELAVLRMRTFNSLNQIKAPRQITSRGDFQAHASHRFTVLALSCCFAVSSVVQAADPVGTTRLGGGALASPTLSGTYNTGIGDGALHNDTSGDDNTALGAEALFANQIGTQNTALGNGALNRTTGNDNTAVGATTLLDTTDGNQNTAIGSQALHGDSNFGLNSASYNTATGFQSVYSITNGTYNVANGWNALYSNTSGASNTAIGSSALYSNVSGDGNTAIGERALANSTGPGGNIAIGQVAGYNLTTGIGNIDIGNQGVAGDSGKIRIGTKGTQTATFIAGIFGKTVKSGTAVLINANGQLGTVQSSARFKDDIKPMDSSSQSILKLRPVSFRYKEDLDPDKTPQFGLIAEEVEKVNPDLIVRDDEGKAMTVRYDQINAMLLNEFLKEHQTVAELKDIAQQQQRTITQQQEQIEALTAVVQKVTAKLKPSEAAEHAVTAQR